MAGRQGRTFCGLRKSFGARPVSAVIDFYFDFSSPYSYIASELVEAIAERQQRSVVWHPMVIGTAFRAVGGAALPALPMKSEYVERDVARLARSLAIPFKWPTHHPIPTHLAAYAFLYGQDRDPERAKAFARKVFAAYFVEDRNIAEIEVVVEIIETFGFERGDALEALNGSGLKERLKAETDVALARGVFGVPFCIVSGEPFWGYSRLPLLEKWIAEGPF